MRTHAGGEAAIAEAVAAVHPAEAQQIGLDEHHGVHDRPTRRLSSLYMSMEPQSIRDMASMSGVGLVRYAERFSSLPETYYCSGFKF